MHHVHYDARDVMPPRGHFGRTMATAQPEEFRSPKLRTVNDARQQPQAHVLSGGQAARTPATAAPRTERVQHRPFRPTRGYGNRRRWGQSAGRLSGHDPFSRFGGGRRVVTRRYGLANDAAGLMPRAVDRRASGVIAFAAPAPGCRSAHREPLHRAGRSTDSDASRLDSNRLRLDQAGAAEHAACGGDPRVERLALRLGPPMDFASRHATRAPQVVHRPSFFRRGGSVLTRAAGGVGGVFASCLVGRTLSGRSTD
jgi:hypothetical protein